MEIVTKIHKENQAKKLLQKFDKKHNTTTWIFDATIADVDHYLLNDLYRNEPLMELEECFEPFENNFFMTNNPLFVEDQKKDINDRQWHQLSWCYSIWQLTNSIKQEGMLHPIGIQRFDNGGMAAHPGTTRLRFHNYKTPQQIILTDYSDRNFAQDFPQFNARPVALSKLRNVVGLSHKISDMEDLRPKTLYQVSKKRVTWQCISSMWQTNHSPSLLDPPISYEMKDDKVYINNQPVIVKRDGHWRVNL